MTFAPRSVAGGGGESNEVGYCGIRKSNLVTLNATSFSYGLSIIDVNYSPIQV